MRSTRDQVELSAAERRANVAGTFSAGGHPRGRLLLLVEDVITIGATLSARAATLLRAGAAVAHAVSLLCRTC